MQQFADRFPKLAAALGPQNLAVLTRAMTLLELGAGRRIIRDRMPVDSLYFILEGEVSILLEEGGRSILLGRLGAGEWLGEVSVLSGEMVASSTVRSETAVRLARLKHQAFEELIVRNEEIASAMLRELVGMLAARLRSSNEVSRRPITVESMGDSFAATQPIPSAAGGGRNWLASFFGR
jgi:CRP-like cAMP-binding protein